MRVVCNIQEILTIYAIIKIGGTLVGGSVYGEEVAG